MNELEEFWKKFFQYASDAASRAMPILFRGEPKAGNPLYPSIGRRIADNVIGGITPLEDELMFEFKRLATPLLINNLPSDDFEWLFLAQHYGLPTRLLDWTTNPLVGLFFAVEKDDTFDAILYIVNTPYSDQYWLFDPRTADVIESEQIGISQMFPLLPKQKEVIFLRPKYTDQRYLNQKSVFSCQADPFMPLELENLTILEIKKEWKSELRRRLRTMGISHSYLYPGLEGISKEIKTEIFLPIETGKMMRIHGQSTIPMPPNKI